MSALEEGGMFDEDTMPEWMKSMRGVAPMGPGAPGSQGPPRLGGMPVASLVGAPAVQGGQDIAAAAAAAAAFNLGMPPQLPPGAGLLPPPTNLPPQGTSNRKSILYKTKQTTNFQTGITQSNGSLKSIMSISFSHENLIHLDSSGIIN